MFIKIENIVLFNTADYNIDTIVIKPGLITIVSLDSIKELDNIKCSKDELKVVRHNDVISYGTVTYNKYVISTFV